MPGELAGLEVIQAHAARLGIDISDTVKKAQMIMQSDPAALRQHGTDLSTVATGLAAGQQDMHRTGNDVLANSQGQYADAFGPYHDELVAHVGTTAETANTLSAHVHAVANNIQSGQDTVVSATGITATALNMLRA
ncbi:WXG100 family type VII secretion target [Labedaea rhizosphaerae]|uniref:Type VII secretion system (Wss) protein ESAT-6 n=1 Tax=Labedaea rhizosphaerae TaxID=598644 RepID=A0A4R6SNY1_LABRH|nr:WXG100 family type VII secretion target [Labedaea rhizosphaerae]TDQ04913.1 type VII secretion system (Wss) protein ESAT-6 [Labedaea rhizosphaerae]